MKVQGIVDIEGWFKEVAIYDNLRGKKDADFYQIGESFRYAWSDTYGLEDFVKNRAPLLIAYWDFLDWRER